MAGKLDKVNAVWQTCEMLAKTDRDALVEVLANIEHERWSGWMLYQFKSFTVENLVRWFAQTQTKYQDLAEHHKETDRLEALKTLDAIFEAGYTVEKR